MNILFACEHYRQKGSFFSHCTFNIKIYFRHIDTRIIRQSNRDRESTLQEKTSRNFPFNNHKFIDR